MNQKYRITLTLSAPETEVLARRAQMECRPMRDHARYLVLRALGLLDDPAASPAAPQREEAASA